MQLSIVLGMAALISIVMRLLRQPLIIGYILTGLAAGPAVFGIIKDQAAFASFSQIGITLLLFIVGLGLDIKLIRSTGKPAFVSFVTNFALVCLSALAMTGLFGFTVTEAFLMGVGMVLSSTIVVVKSLSDEREQNRLHGRLAIGVLLVEDIAATIVLILLATANGGAGDDFIQLAARGLLLAAALALTGWTMLPRLARFFAASQEFLFTFALAWAFSVAAIFDAAGFSVEVGALFAGVSLASLPYAQEISTRLKPLRDFFLLLFFISMGEHLTLDGIAGAMGAAVFGAFIVTFVKPFGTSNALGALNYTKQTSFKTAARLSQVSEFSIVMLSLAYAEGLVGGKAVSVMTLTALITIASSTYLMKYDGALYRRFKRILPVIERVQPASAKGKASNYSFILFGYRRGGHEFISTFRGMRKPYVVIDHSPAVIELLERQRIPAIFGDATNYELLQETGIANAELVVSVLPGIHANLTLLEYLQKHNPEVIFICHANDHDDAARLYQKGASYVMLPHYIGSEKMSAFILHHGNDKTAFDAYKEKHLAAIHMTSAI